MKGRTAAALTVAGFGLGALAVAGLAEDDARRGLGIYWSHFTDDKYDLSVGMTATAQPRLPDRFVEPREHLIVPNHYGDLFQITQNGNDSIFWYRSNDGSVRNAVVANATTKAFQIDRGPVGRLEIKVR